MGVDVGGKLHVVIRRRAGDTWPLVAVMVLDSFEELDPLIRRYNVRSCVIDAQPEQHKALEFAKHQPRKVMRCYYDRQKGEHDWDEEKAEVHANRTLLLDETFAGFRDGYLLLPDNARDLIAPIESGYGEYYRHLMAPVRLTEPAADGNPVNKYVSRGRDDHFAHAEAYCMLAILNPHVRRPMKFLHVMMDAVR